MKKTILLITTIISIFMISGCASKQTERAPRERDETYVADLDPFNLETFHLYSINKNGKPKITDFTISFAPRSNYLFVSSKTGINVVRTGFSYQERKALKEAHDLYISQLNSGTIDRTKPSKKNAYNRGIASVEWGLGGIGYETNTFYMTNAYFLEENKPYFRILMEAAEEKPGNQLYSPKYSIFISPAQWEKIEELCRQENLEARVDEILAEANEF